MRREILYTEEKNIGKRMIRKKKIKKLLKKYTYKINKI